MSDRRNFLKKVAGAGSLALISTPVLSSVSNLSEGSHTSVDKMRRPSSEKNIGLDKTLGLGGVPLASGFKHTTTQSALDTLEAAWAAGIRYFDTSPRYGFGLSERRMGLFLTDKDPDEYILSTKVGRLLKAQNSVPEHYGVWKGPKNFDYTYDYSAEGARRSIEASLQRLGVNQIDIVLIHDLSPDNGDMGDKWTDYYQVAAKGCIPELERMRDEGLIKAWGFGVNSPDAALKSLEISKPDVHLLATKYTLIDHEESVTKTFPLLEKHGVKVIVGSPLNCGYLAGSETWNYTNKPAPAEIAEKRNRLLAVAQRHGVDLRSASLQFSMAAPVVSAVLTGARTPKQIIENQISLKGVEKIPQAFWQELKQAKLLHPEAVTPSYKEI